jgi:GDPmannose 4,6-dehydratase
MLQHHEASDYVLATGTSHSVRDFVQFCFDAVELDWEKFVELDERYLRPTEVDALIGDYSKAKNVLGWEPKVLPAELAKIMVVASVERKI